MGFSPFKVVLWPTGVYRNDTHFCTSGVQILDYCHLSYWVQSRPSNSAGCAWRCALSGIPSPCSLAYKPRSSDRGYQESEALPTVARHRFLSRQGDEHVPRSQTSDNISVQPRHQDKKGIIPGRDTKYCTFNKITQHFICSSNRLVNTKSIEGSRMEKWEYILKNIEEFWWYNHQRNKYQGN